ncbi:MAG: TonB-dependent receptor [Bacteroidetes bacterium]|nr:TonB-dependent receptor [Bacteroidota bacterium]
MRYVFFILAVFTATIVSSQNSLNGRITDEHNNPLQYATVVLLRPADSTMVYYAVSNPKGLFTINAIKSGEYIAQVSFIGYQSWHKKVAFPDQKGSDLGNIVLRTATMNLNEVDVKGELSPMVIKKDTIEYNADAFKVRPDASTEDLLRKLPGVEVDRDGSIKAMGETVSKVMVDGKEFFSNDPKVATKNLPAGAVKKVQVYDKTSEESKFTGMKEGAQGKEMNLVLKDDHKKGIFGDIMAGGGTDERYQANAKVFNFAPKYQYAALGMLNNINQYGFTVDDYINYNGGIGAFMSGGTTRIRISSDGDFPVDMGQPITGQVTSGAAGVNFSYQANDFNRLNISYLMNGNDKNQTDSTFSRNYLANNEFEQYSNQKTYKNSLAQRVNFSWRNRIDSVGQFFANGGISFSKGNSVSNGDVSSFTAGEAVNTMISETTGKTSKVSGDMNLSYIWKINQSKSVLKTFVSANGYTSMNHQTNESETQYLKTSEVIQNNLFDNNDYSSGAFTLGTKFTQRIGRQFFIEPQLSYTRNADELSRRTGVIDISDIVNQELSPDLNHFKNIFSPEISFKFNSEKDMFQISAKAEMAQLRNSITDTEDYSSSYMYFLPSLRWEREYKQAHRFTLDYNTSIVNPTVDQLLSVEDRTNSLLITKGNRYLKPEYNHAVSASWMIYDQFSFTSLFVNSSVEYTKNKINWQRSIEDNLSQRLTLINTDEEFRGFTRIDFSTPLRKLGIKTNAGITQSWNIGQSIVNDVNNKNTNLVHKLSLGIENRNKDKWDATVGASISYTIARYDIQKSLNNNYIDFNYYTDLRYMPNTSWDFQLTADVKNYGAQSFEKAVSIPIVNLTASYYFLKNKRGSLSLTGHDLLDKNKGIQRVSELNYLRETYSDVIGRYAMLSFKYRLSMVNNNQGVKVSVNRR